MRAFRFSLRSFEPTHFGTGWMSGVASAALGAPRSRRRCLLPLSVASHGAGVAQAVPAAVCPRAAAPGAGRGLHARRREHLPASEQGAGGGGHHCRRWSRRFSAARRFRSDGGELTERAVHRPRLVPAQHDRLLGGLHPARAALRSAARAVDVSRRAGAPIWRTSSVSALLRSGHDAPDDEAGDGASFSGPPIRACRRGCGASRSSLQFVAILVLTDLTQYWIHRAFHAVPVLWRFHQIHHSAETMDWLAGSRLHLVDVAVTRGLTYVPIYLLGFARRRCSPTSRSSAFRRRSSTPTSASSSGRWRGSLATPQFHHWHHGAEREAVDKNFAVHLPVLDWLFGTFHLPKGRWPASYGLSQGATVPDGYVRQFAYPFQDAEKRAAAHDQSRTR